MNNTRIYNFTNNLKTIDTPDKAYWFGFLYADGSVSNRGISLELHRRDYIQLQNFNDFMESTSLIKLTKKDCARTFINSVKMSNELKSIGLIQNKTKIYQKLFIDENLLQHFYRGLIDGDGWITQITKNNHTQYCFGLCSSHLEILIDFKSFIINKLNVKKIGSLTQRARVNQFVINGNKNFEKIVELLGYNKYYSMPRKLELVNSAINIIKKQRLDIIP